MRRLFPLAILFVSLLPAQTGMNLWLIGEDTGPATHDLRSSFKVAPKDVFPINYVPTNSGSQPQIVQTTDNDGSLIKAISWKGQGYWKITAPSPSVFGITDNTTMFSAYIRQAERWDRRQEVYLLSSFSDKAVIPVAIKLGPSGAVTFIIRNQAGTSFDVNNGLGEAFTVETPIGKFFRIAFELRPDGVFIANLNGVTRKFNTLIKVPSDLKGITLNLFADQTGQIPFYAEGPAVEVADLKIYNTAAANNYLWDRSIISGYRPSGSKADLPSLIPASSGTLTGFFPNVPDCKAELFADQEPPARCDVRVKIGGKSVPVLKASPNGVDVVIPNNIATGETSISVSDPKAIDTTIVYPVAASAPFALTYNFGGIDYAVATRANGIQIFPVQGKTSLAGNPALRKEEISVFLTGLPVPSGGVSSLVIPERTEDLPTEGLFVYLVDKREDSLTEAYYPVEQPKIVRSTRGYALYELRLTIPIGTPNGDHPIRFLYGGKEYRLPPVPVQGEVPPPPPSLPPTPF